MATEREKRALISLCDPVLRPLLEAMDAPSRDRALNTIMTREVAPVIERTIARHPFYILDSPEDREDLLSTVRLRIIAKLRRLFLSRDEAIKNLGEYVATVTYNTIYDALRRRFPERTRLRNRLRYAVAHDERMGMTLQSGGTVFVLGSWPEAAEARTRPLPFNLRVTEGMHDSGSPARALHELLIAAGHPILVEDAVDFFFELWNVVETDSTETAAARPDPSGSPLTQVEDRQHLTHLLDELRQLPTPQRTALLLNLRDADGGSPLALLILAGVTTFEELAAMADLSPQEMTSLWNDLPLDDLTLAQRLGRTRQQVINLRKSARERLLRRLARRGLVRK